MCAHTAGGTGLRILICLHRGGERVDRRRREPQPRRPPTFPLTWLFLFPGPGCVLECAVISDDPMRFLTTCLTLALAAGALHAAAAPPPAQSFVIRGTRAMPPSTVALPGPAFAGTRVVWAESRAGLAVHLLAAAAPTEAPRTLAVVRRPDPTANAATVSVDGGPSRVTLRVEYGRCGLGCARDGPMPIANTVLAGPVGDLRPLGPDATDLRFRSIAAPVPVGDHVAYWGAEGATFVDPLGGERVVRGGYPHAVAGELLVTYPVPARPSVVEWRTGRELYAPEVEPGLLVTSMQADGTVLWRSCCGRYRLTSPSDVRGRDVALPGAVDFPAPLLAHNRIAYRTRSGFAVADSAGGAVARVDTPVGSADATSIDFDGQRLAWLAVPCALGHVVVWHLGDPPPRMAAAGCTRAQLPRQTSFSGRRFAAILRCPRRATEGCGEEARLEVLRRGGDVVASVYTRLMMAPGERGRVATPVVRAALRGRRLRVRLTTFTVGRDIATGRRVRWFRLRVP